MTPRTFLALLEPVRQGIEESFGLAESLDDGCGLLTFAGVEHALLAYRVHADEFDLTLRVMAAMTDEVWLREVDFYDAGLDEDAYSPIEELILNTLTYLSAREETDI